MRSFALALDRKLLLAVLAAAALAIQSTSSQAQPDPPAQGGRISYITGAVSIQPAGSDNWEQAIPNLPLGPGDRVFTDSDGEAEIQVGETFVRIGPNSDVSLIDSTPTGLYFGVAQGSAHLHAFNFWPGQRLYVNTPSGTSVIGHPGEMRVDVYPDQQAALFTDLGTNTIITGADGFNQEIGTGMALELMGSNPVTPQWLDTAPPDALDNWSVQRDQQIAQAQSYQYVSREIPGAYELDAAGTWQPGTPYGAVWFPNNVEAGWAPYHNGHWINHAPWGYVWVEDESWGYAPFHYGRWVSYNGRWGWVAGPPAAHPIWSPALVVFAGGISVGGGGVSAWFPLGPGEPYHPWYPCSPRYVDQVNITNIVEAPRVHVQTTYVNINITNVTYVNRTIAVTAISQADFASGRPVRQAAVKIDVNMIQHAQPLATPSLPKPNVSAMAGRPPARPVRVAAARPVLINENGKAVSAKPGAVPMAPPVKPAPPAKALPGHTAIAAPANARPQVGGKPPAPVVPAKTAPAEKAAPEKPAVEKPSTEKPAPPTAAKPPVKPAPATTTKPGAATPVKPIPAATPAPVVKPGTTPPAKPGTTPPAKTDKDKKAAKDKDKDKNKDPDDQDKKPQ